MASFADLMQPKGSPVLAPGRGAHAAFPDAPPGSGGTSHMLPAERKRATFDVAALMEIMGTDKRLKQLEKARAIFSEAGSAFDSTARKLMRVVAIA